MKSFLWFFIPFLIELKPGTPLAFHIAAALLHGTTAIGILWLCSYTIGHGLRIGLGL